MGTHKGQVSFPGGMMEAGESAEEAAIRETIEEIGVAREDVDILGACCYTIITEYLCRRDNLHAAL